MSSLGGEYRMLEKMIIEKRKEVNALAARKKEIGEKLKSIMETKKIETFQGVDLEEVTSKPRPKRMTKKEKEDHAIGKLRQMGIPNPRAAYAELGF